MWFQLSHFTSNFSKYIVHSGVAMYMLLGVLEERNHRQTDEVTSHPGPSHPDGAPCSARRSV